MPKAKYIASYKWQPLLKIRHPLITQKTFGSYNLKRSQESIKHVLLWVTELREEVTVAYCDVIGFISLLTPQCIMLPDNSEWIKTHKRVKASIILTCINIFTDINNTWRLTNATTRYMKNSIKDIWMSIVHTDSAKYIVDKEWLNSTSTAQICDRRQDKVINYPDKLSIIHPW